MIESTHHGMHRLFRPAALRFVLLLLGLFLVTPPPAVRAQLTTYTTSSSFIAASSTTKLFDFENIASTNNFSPNPTLSGLSVFINGGGDNNYYVADSGYRNSTGNYDLNGTDNLLAGRARTSQPTVTLQFSSAVTAFGTEIGFRDGDTIGGTVNSLTAQVFNGATQVGATYTYSSFSTGYLGFTSTQAFDRVKITTVGLDGSYQSYDNLRLGNANTPEPGSLALLFTGGVSSAFRLAVLAFRRRKKHGK